MNIKETKGQARVLVTSLRNLGIRLKHHQALEVLSHLKGAKGWNQFCASSAIPKAVMADEDKILLEQAVASHVQTIGVPDADRPVKLVAAGDVHGNVNGMQAYYEDGENLLEESLVLMEGLPGRKPYAPSVRFVTAVLANKGGRCVAQLAATLNPYEVLNRTIDIELKYNNAAVKSVCPLTKDVHKPYIGIYPFQAGTWDPFEREIMPDRVWGQVISVEEHCAQAAQLKENPADVPEFVRLHMGFEPQLGHRVTVTLGEIRQQMLKSMTRSS